MYTSIHTMPTITVWTRRDKTHISTHQSHKYRKHSDLWPLRTCFHFVPLLTVSYLSPLCAPKKMEFKIEWAELGSDACFWKERRALCYECHSSFIYTGFIEMKKSDKKRKYRHQRKVVEKQRENCIIMLPKPIEHRAQKYTLRWISNKMLTKWKSETFVYCKNCLIYSVELYSALKHNKIDAPLKLSTPILQFDRASNIIRRKIHPLTNKLNEKSYISMDTHCL